ncbi:hypothetical protein COW36_06670 [bacterium (Candidatus Blackallbacteria) CG17_big_fil_post_rev_8_21_14_2_50_48_46]|uniref:Uncharacterized protein n=1 Tax=bacterium (Candidatus Blackallbacteria) CG17_big_fil_post_rev_8_21_14_2_50_48_46 TaxID=2014261 RepID=A0A2M7G7K7_9BACT|nr:MAG: hypothetical protein COW64_12085 [bacterium (Candidatus Blackallbacteria) CG18_big_fil_WC_8_21_14_2_50_49_26]PIW17955.1 MAG: hypothetical protein COW36_06670 [bacterium (Candidatus Blackallbacteria) CG17_big_fil_post_rev_8_21_14_2_50_48_46]
MIFSAIALFMSFVLCAVAILASRTQTVEHYTYVTIQPALKPLPSQQASLPVFAEVPSNN